MNLNKVKGYIQEIKNTSCKFVYKGTRNQKEEFYGVIIKCFPSVFVVQTTDNVIRTFSYNDFIMNNIKIISL